MFIYGKLPNISQYTYIVKEKSTKLWFYAIFRINGEYKSVFQFTCIRLEKVWKDTQDTKNSDPIGDKAGWIAEMINKDETYYDSVYLKFSEPCDYITYSKN